MQYPHPLQMSCCTTTVPNSVRNSAPVGQTSRQAACVQCLHTSDDISHLTPASSGGPIDGRPRSTVGTSFSMNATCRHVAAPSASGLSYDVPVNAMPSSGSSFHSLQATSQALQPMHTDVSVKKPIPPDSCSPPPAHAPHR